jgi:hypothetical protein
MNLGTHGGLALLQRELVVFDRLCQDWMLDLRIKTVLVGDRRESIDTGEG